MSTNTFPVFFPSTFLTTSNSTLYTVPNSPTSIVLQELQLKFTNVTNATRTITVYAVPSGQPVDIKYAVAFQMSVPPNDYILLPVHRLAASGTVQALCDVADSVAIQPIGGKLHTP